MERVDLAPTLARGMPKSPTHPYPVIDPIMRHERDGYKPSRKCNPSKPPASGREANRSTRNRPESDLLTSL